jgi:RNA-directed DNA polymerase
MLLFSAPALDSRLKDVYVNLTNIAGLRVIEVRRSLLRVDKNPYLLEDQKYFEKLRVKRAGEYMDFNQIHSKLFKKQKGLCAICLEVLEFTDKLEVDHIKPLSQGGSNRISNKRLVHFSCHRNRIHGKG